MADSFWTEAQEYKKLKVGYTDLLFQKATSLANNASKTSNNDSEVKDAPSEKSADKPTGDITAAMTSHSLNEADAAKIEEKAAIDKRDTLKFLRVSPVGMDSDKPVSFDLKRITDTIKKTREESERGKSKIKKGEWEKIDRLLGVRK